MRRLIFASFVLCVIFIFNISALAEGASEADILDSFSEAAREVDEELPFSNSEKMSEAGDAVIEFLTPERILDELFGIGAASLKGSARLFFLLSALVLLSAVCNSVAGGVSGTAVSRGVSFLGSAAVMAAILKTQLSAFDTITDFFERLGSLMNSMIPIGGAVLAMGGNVSTAGVGTASLYAMLAVTENLCAAAVLPVCCVMGTAAICSALSGGGLLEGFCGAVKKIYNFVLGLVMCVFVFVLGAQTSLASAADTLAVRGGKFVSSVVIPGVGGVLGETIRTLAGSVSYIKNVVGVGGIVLIGVLTLPVLISLLTTRLVFLLTGTMAQMLDCKTESKLLGELGNIYGFLVGAVSICSVAFIVALALFVKCTVAIE